MDPTFESVIKQIDDKLQSMEIQMNALRAKMTALKTTRATLLEEFSEGHPDTPSDDRTEKVTRKNELINFLVQFGPAHRRKIVEMTGIPEGTIAYEMRDRNTFMMLSDGRWDLTFDLKRLLSSAKNVVEDDDAITDDDVPF